jgi:hypothetical protein
MRVAQPARKVTVWSVSTGEALERWSVDAAALVASGDYRGTAHEESSPDVPPPADPRPSVPLPDGLERKTKAQVDEYARLVLGMSPDPTLTKRGLLEAIGAHLSRPPVGPTV